MTTLFLAIQAGCPDSTARDLLALVGGVSVIAVVGVVLVTCWELWGNRVRAWVADRRTG